MQPVTFRDLQKGLRDLGLTPESRVLVAASLPAFGLVRGGAETVAGAVTSLCRLVVSPSFTLQCRVWPLAGPPNNGVTYAGHDDENALAEMFSLALPVHPSLGPVAEAFRHVSGALRSRHPLYSFVAVGPEAEQTLLAQSLADPLGPIAHLAEAGSGADLLLLGAGHTENLALHYAEARAGRKQFVRWALTPKGAVECPACPGCPDGFNAIVPHLRGLSRVAQIGTARVERLPLGPLLQVAVDLLRRDPAALLCTRPGCERCFSVRTALAGTRQSA
jgi:aminoglycoside 3-N-acetyltransferase